MTEQAAITIDETTGILQCSGEWTLSGIVSLQDTWRKLAVPPQTTVTIVGKNISHMDSAGAWLLQTIISHYQTLHKTMHLSQFAPEQEGLLSLIGEETDKIQSPPSPPPTHNTFYNIGKDCINKMLEVSSFLAFIGEIAHDFVKCMRKLQHLQWAGLFHEIDKTGYRALPIIALLSFLIGIVLTYQMGLQLQTYGANIFIVNLSGMAILREFGPLITAIIVAGRTSSSFTAEIGLMKVNEEIDALRTMGLSPIERLVIPKLLGLIIALPLLTVWADAFGVFGSMVMSKGMLNIGYTDFLNRFQEVIELSDYGTGLCKAPIFAMIIATVGCFQGLQVSMSAESVGRLTTKSVVQAIFLIIIADAGFSIVFSWLGI